MRNVRLGILLAVVAILPTARSAEAQVAGLIFGNQWPKVIGKYRKDNVIRASAIDARNGNLQAMFRLALVELAKLSREKGYPRFAVVKVSDCGVMTVNGARAAVTCRLVGQMLRDSQAALPDGNNSITYYRTEDVLAGRTNPEGQSS